MQISNLKRGLFFFFFLFLASCLKSGCANDSFNCSSAKGFLEGAIIRLNSDRSADGITADLGTVMDGFQSIKEAGEDCSDLDEYYLDLCLVSFNRPGSADRFNASGLSMKCFDNIASDYLDKVGSLNSSYVDSWQVPYYFELAAESALRGGNLTATILHASKALELCKLPIHSCKSKKIDTEKDCGKFPCNVLGTANDLLGRAYCDQALIDGVASQEKVENLSLAVDYFKNVTNCGVISGGKKEGKYCNETVQPFGLEYVLPNNTVAHLNYTFYFLTNALLNATFNGTEVGYAFGNASLYRSFLDPSNS